MNGAIVILQKWAKLCNGSFLCSKCLVNKQCPCGRLWAESGIHAPRDWSDEDILNLVKTLARADIQENNNET